MLDIEERAIYIEDKREGEECYFPYKSLVDELDHDLDIESALERWKEDTKEYLEAKTEEIVESVEEECLYTEISLGEITEILKKHTSVDVLDSCSPRDLYFNESISDVLFGDRNINITFEIDENLEDVDIDTIVIPQKVEII